MATAVFSVLTLHLVQQHNFEQGLRVHADNNLLERLEPLSEALAKRYAEAGNWGFVRGTREFNLGRLARAFNRTRNDSQQSLPFNLGRDLGSRSVLEAISILDSDSRWVAGARINRLSATKEILLEDQIIGYLALTPRRQLTRQIDQRFAEQQSDDGNWASLAILIGALLSALLISRNLGQPIKELNEQVQSLSDGKYDIRMKTDRDDELGSLAKNFNKLSTVLQENRDQRRQWISDISHELRTPVSILQAEIECIEDGLQPLDLDTISNLKSEVERINLLITDLHQLSQADSGTMTFDFVETDIKAEIKTALRNNQDQFKQKDIVIETDYEETPNIWCDPNRMQQVINNLLQNTLRYTDSPGQLKISAKHFPSNNKISLTFADSTPGVPEASIERLFDRLYRVDPSRSRKTGSSGLGLSICAAIIKAHSGKITANRSALGGLAIYIELPITQPSTS